MFVMMNRMSVPERLKDRYAKFRNFGKFNEPKPVPAAAA